MGDRGCHVGKVDPRHPLASAPEPAAHSQPERRKHGGQSAPLRGEHDPDSEGGGLDSAVPGGAGGGLPLPAHLGQEVVSGGGVFDKLFVAARPVVADGGGGEQSRGPIPGGAEGRDQGFRAFDPALANGALPGGRPAFPDRLSGKVDQGVEPFQHTGRVGVGSVTARVPAGGSDSGREPRERTFAPGEHHHFVAPSGKFRSERAADQARRSRDSSPHPKWLTTRRRF